MNHEETSAGRRSAREARMSGYTTVPYTIAFANELVTDPIKFEQHGYELRLTYEKPRPADWVHGILRARVRDLLDKPEEVRGAERMRKLNTRRQWRCMRKLLCQVCGEPAQDSKTRLIPWLLTRTVFERTGPDSGRTNAPPCCWDCIPKALEECHMLQKDFSLYTVASIRSVGVLADMYECGLFSLPALAKRNVFVAWDAHRYHSSALAVAHMVELHGMTHVP
ncbi:hypothetical protein DMB42_11370 [Nonomuraea sp. WAC 01424]|uniref:hypothetical protein n=1 Tax=Nonomuraea sp. WAC 01424 TaxID=2203200 RepID=UPI000F7718CB|nr:hypothetical protein [Nonomuraea sp. WAC 01424]RSN12771.1 hypothetical protein DMB42_11370 [Nonomuraea sp. WAC 01424]